MLNSEDVSAHNEYWNRRGWYGYPHISGKKKCEDFNCHILSTILELHQLAIALEGCSVNQTQTMKKTSNWRFS